MVSDVEYPFIFILAICLGILMTLFQGKLRTWVPVSLPMPGPAGLMGTGQGAGPPGWLLEPGRNWGPEAGMVVAHPLRHCQ